MNINQQAEQRAIQICESLNEFIKVHNVSKTMLAAAMGIKQQNINKLLDQTKKPKLHSILLMQIGLEQVTGIPLQAPTMTTIRKP